MQLISANQWASFRQAINAASDTFNNELIEWKHLIKKLDYFGDDREGNTEFETIELLALIQYNAWNVLPTDRINVDGITDKDTIIIILNKDYLRGLDLLDTNGNFKFNPDFDRFVVKGVVFKNGGDTQTAQAYDDTLLQYIIAIKDELETGR